ncbi:SGNH/GDSL hydrolase family protein [Nocardia sp. CDC153]|uniref:SGNH/GDSL hydrolase family protein n=1 Tax=Nocardia sp. CDC153 TaxID=3112167 RepID=UPI002DB7180D|nr:SGNH/GDSL hydrolase family protein [Nocardia sp. CDC153]MEC3958411.1 SGNH/GDSL hydrolase family protein [Nocardia sp. CDC153]
MLAIEDFPDRHPSLTGREPIAVIVKDMNAVERADQDVRGGLTWRARSLVVLGDSTAVGIGDPLPGGGWRGVGPLLAEALGGNEIRYTNLSFVGARMACVRERQLAAAVRSRPDVALLLVGMNDTLRSNFDPAGMRADLEHVLSRLAAVGTVVVTVRFHDHGKIFRIPRPLRRALRQRITALNAVIDAAAARHDARCVDIDLLPGAYDLRLWSVDRLHPSELGHRVLAAAFTELLADEGCAIPYPVSLVCSGGREVSTVGHLGWLVARGIPWLVRRSRDLLPYVALILLRWAVGLETEESPGHGAIQPTWGNV